MNKTYENRSVQSERASIEQRECWTSYTYRAHSIPKWLNNSIQGDHHFVWLDHNPLSFTSNMDFLRQSIFVFARHPKCSPTSIIYGSDMVDIWYLCRLRHQCYLGTLLPPVHTVSTHILRILIFIFVEFNQFNIVFGAPNFVDNKCRVRRALTKLNYRISSNAAHPARS